MARDSRLVSERVAAFVAERGWEAIPDAVRERAKLLMLDAIGIAYASTRREFAHKALTALGGLGGGDAGVIGMPARLAMRDAALMNGILIHGLDYDDTYLPGGVHMTASCVPAALGMAAHVDASGRDLLLACVLGLEASARIGRAANGGFLKAGFHPTTLAGTFGCALIAGRLLCMSPAQLVLAQGVALSTVSGTLQPIQEGAWTKRMHPGWAAACGITSAALARQGFIGPLEPYEGQYGLYSSCFLGAHVSGADLSRVTEGLGTHWEFPRASIKLFPACHQVHAFLNAALELKRQHAIEAADVESVETLVAEAAVPIVCEPLAAKCNPGSSYAAQFSLPYSMACALARGRFGLDEIGESSYSDAALLALARKVTYRIDPDAEFPAARSGEVLIHMKGGKTLRLRRSISPDEPAPAEAIVGKFMQNTEPVLSIARAEAVREMVMSLDEAPKARAVVAALAAG